MINQSTTSIKKSNQVTLQHEQPSLCVHPFAIIRCDQTCYQRHLTKPMHHSRLSLATQLNLMLIKICTKSSKSLKNSTNYQPLSSIDLNMMVTSNKSSKDMVRSVETVKSYAEKEVNCKAAEALCQTMRAKVTNMDTWRNKPESKQYRRLLWRRHIMMRQNPGTPRFHRK